MNYCANCGKQIEGKINFCPNCGSKNQAFKIPNKIDHRYDKFQKNISSIKTEISGSEALNKLSEKTGNIVHTVFRIIGVIGFIILGILFLIPITTDNDFIIKSAYDSNMNVTGVFKNPTAFFGETMLIYIPVFLIYLGFNDNSFIKTSAILIAVGLTFYTITLFN